MILGIKTFLNSGPSKPKVPREYLFLHHFQAKLIFPCVYSAFYHSQLNPIFPYVFLVPSHHFLSSQNPPFYLTFNILPPNLYIPILFFILRRMKILSNTAPQLLNELATSPLLSLPFFLYPLLVTVLSPIRKPSCPLSQWNWLFNSARSYSYFLRFHSSPFVICSILSL